MQATTLPVIKNKEQLTKKSVAPKVPFLLKLVRFGFARLGPLMPGLAAQIAYRLFTTPRRRARHHQTDPILEKARVFEILYGHRMLKAYEWGSGDQIVLLVHGWESRGTALRSFVPGLVAAGYKVVAFDGPAHGNSEGKTTNLPHFAGVVRAVLHHLGNVEGIICHSFGGAATAYALAQNPDFSIKHLVLIGVPSNMHTVMQQFFKVIAAPPSVHAKFFEFIEKKFNTQLESMYTEHSVKAADVDQIMVVHDEWDKEVSIKEGRRIAAATDKAQLLLTQGFGHFKLMKSPEVIREVTQFITRE